MCRSLNIAGAKEDNPIELGRAGRGEAVAAKQTKWSSLSVCLLFHSINVLQQRNPSTGFRCVFFYKKHF